MEPSLARYIWRHTKAQQVWILAIVLISMPTYFLALDLPKRIINGPIQGRGFETPDATQNYLSFNLPFTDIVLHDGVELTRMGALALLCAMFLALVCVNGLFKFYINTYKGRLGERMLRRMRYELVDRVLRFPIPQFRKMKASEVSTMVKDEVEPLGGFIGDAFVLPVFLGGQAITALVFIIVQNLWLGGLAAGIVIVQSIFIPRLRRMLIKLAKERQLTARQLSGRVGEIVEGVAAVRTNDTSNWERAEITNRLGRIFLIRYEFYQKKFFIKFLNNFLAQFTPFLFYSIGGYLAIRGTLDIGQLVAVIAAYKDLPSPVKELIDWDQQRVDVQVKYAQVSEQFAVDGMVGSLLQKPDIEKAEPLSGTIDVSNLAITDDSGAKLIERANYSGDMSERVAVVGGVNSGAETFIEALARLVPPTSGSIQMGGRQLYNLSESRTGRRIGYASADTFLPQASLEDTIVYTLLHAPLRPSDDTDEEAGRLRELAKVETRLSGNTPLEISDVWIDYEAIGVETPEAMTQHLLELLRFVGLDNDVHDLGLLAIVEPEEFPELANSILEARRTMRERLAESGLSNSVEPFDPGQYNAEATIGENLFFGRPIGREFADASAFKHPYVARILKDTGLDAKLYAMGIEIAQTMSELFAELSPDDPLFDQFAFFRPEEMSSYQTALSRHSETSLDKAPEDIRAMFLKLPFSYAEPRHRFGLVTDELKASIVEARKAFQENYPEELEGAIAFYDPESYNHAASVEDNVIFGRIASGVAEAPERVRALVLEILEGMGLDDTIRRAGLYFDIGTGGKRLTQVQRQRINIARALLKKPDLLLLNRALGSLDPRAQLKLLKKLIDDSAPEGPRAYGMICLVSQPEHAELFDRVLVFKDGVLVEDGEPKALRKAGGHFAKALS
ncbi:ABC transporter transmembrane domain-containing protein [Tepidamorphus sp. 3E244]|uniref:ABC transporter transmembrane domain-containing protein n=1 Tax=Tepidamorphus sp. 3E244 TaxID=3385498 RepID=UPI0038FC389C